MKQLIETEQQQIRTSRLRAWVAEQLLLMPELDPQAGFSLHMVSGDASFRRYFRVTLPDSRTSYIAVDAPPEHENSKQFCKVAALLQQQGCNVPDVLATHFTLGFMLLSDLGDRQLLPELNKDNVEQYYNHAFEQLIKMQAINTNETDLPDYSVELLKREMHLFQEWFLTALLGMQLSVQEQELISQCQQDIAEKVNQQTKVFVHRDFHSRNLMIVQDKLAMIDFQDAVIGPVTYDAVSLLKDCYIEWSESKRKIWLKNYFDKIKLKRIITQDTEFENFYKHFEWMGVQRHLKVLGIFARLSLRDGKHGYLKDLPLTFSYVEQAVENIDELQPFKQWFVLKAKPLFEKKMSSL